MISKERVKRAVNFKSPDRTPIICFNRDFEENVLIEHMRKSDVKIDRDQKMTVDFVKDMKTYLN